MPSATHASLFAGCPRLDASINRLAANLTSDLEPLYKGVVLARIESIFEITGRDLHRNTQILILERLLDAVSHRATKADGLETAFLLGEKLVGLFGEEDSALRKVR